MLVPPERIVDNAEVTTSCGTSLACLSDPWKRNTLFLRAMYNHISFSSARNYTVSNFSVLFILLFEHALLRNLVFILSNHPIVHYLQDGVNEHRILCEKY